MNSFNKISVFSVAAALSVFAASPAFSQTAAEQAAQNNRQVIQQYEQDLFEQELEQSIEREKNALQNDLSIQRQNLEQSGPCIDVNVISIKGISLYQPDEYQNITRNYEGRCLYLSDINALSEDITNLYIEDGYITTRAYIPAQDLSDGSLEILVVEGTLEKIEYFENGSQKDTGQIKYSFPLNERDFLNLRDIEQGLDQINRLHSNDAKMDLSPGAQNGASIIRVENNKSKKWQVETGIDNTGTPSTGEIQGFVNLDYNDLLGISDNLNLSFKHDLERANRRQSRSISARYEIPYGYWNFYYALNYFNYISEVSTALNDFKTTGFSRIHDLGLRRVLHRDKDSKTNLSASFVAKENENFLAGVKLANSSQKLSILNFGLSHSQQIESGFLYGGINYSRGLGWLGAQEDSNLTVAAPKAEFDRVTADISAAKQWDVGLEQYNPRTDLRVRGQWSRDTLFGSEQISAGGPFSVRGLKEASISGDTGYYAQFDVSVPYALETSALANSVGRLRPFVGFDMATIKGDSKNSFEGGTVRSWSLGLKNEGGAFDFEVAFSKPISSPSYIDPETHEIFFKTSIKF